MHWVKNNFYYSKLISLYQGGPKRSAGKKTLQKPHRWGFYVVFDIIRGPAKRGGLFVDKNMLQSPCSAYIWQYTHKKDIFPLFLHYYYAVMSGHKWLNLVTYVASGHTWSHL